LAHHIERLLAMSYENIGFSTNLITFYDTAHWGLPQNLTHNAWEEAFAQDPRRYFEAMFDSVRDSGLTGIELAPNPAGWEAALMAYGCAQELRARLQERGLVLTSSYAHGRQLIGDAMDDVDAQLIADDQFRRHSRFLRDMGADTIVTGNIARSRFGNNSPDDTATAQDFEQPVPLQIHERFANQLNRLGEITSAFGVRIAIHTDAYSICSRNDDITRVLNLTDPKNILLCPDAGHMAVEGSDTVAALRDHIDRIPTMHWKDCAEAHGGHLLRGDQKERHAELMSHFRVLGAGIVDWPAWMEVLRDSHWRGWATEEIDHSPDPVKELRDGMRYFRERLEAIYS
jgi:sugar phosphate isomerase/epimerase